MPFDINVILAAFDASFKPEWKRIVDAFKEMGEKIRKQAERSSMLERASRDLIEWPFQQDALVVQIAASQRFQFPPTGEPPLPASIRQEWLLPGLFIRLKEMTATVRDAIARFNTARPEMFNPSGTRFTDIFGHAALLIRAFVKDYRPVRLLEDVAKVIGGLLPATEKTGTGGGTLAGSLDSVPSMIGGFLLLIPAAMEWIAVLAREASLYARIYILQHLESIQASLHSFKNEFFTTYFEILREMFQGIFEFAFAVRFIFLRNVVWYGAFGGLFIRHIARQLAHYSEVISHAVKLIIVALQVIAALGGAVLSGIVSSIADAPGGPTLPRMPNVFLRGIAPHVSKMKSILHDLRDVLLPGVGDLLNTSGTTMLSIADAADKDARAAVTLGNAAIWRNLNESATEVAETAFAGQSEERRVGLQNSPAELANAYDRALSAGLGTIEAAIPLYISGAVEWWRSRRGARLQGMASPHLMARRARLRRVRVTHLRMQVHGFDMQSDERQDELLARLQQEMRNQIELAWTKGVMTPA